MTEAPPPAQRGAATPARMVLAADFLAALAT